MRTRKRKALSPVIATIILIAVTVAVSIAVAAWMGALTFSFMGSSSLTITSVSFQNGTSGVYTNDIVLTIKNTGTKTVTVGTVKINQVAYTIDPSSSPYPPTYTTSGTAATGTIVLQDVGWINGNPYQFNLYDTSGNALGSYQANSPGS